jgi:glutaredoxin 3
VTKVEIYTKQTCPFCIRAKRLLEMKKVAFDEIAVDRDPSRKAEMVARAGGRMTVPQVFIGGEHIGGCDELMMLEYDGKLDALLAGAERRPAQA